MVFSCLMVVSNASYPTVLNIKPLFESLHNAYKDKVQSSIVLKDINIWHYCIYPLGY